MTHDMDGAEPSSVRTLAYALKLRIAEYTSGHWSEDELRQRLHEEADEV